MKMLAGWRSSKPRIRLLGRSAPSVDVIITCCSEQIDILMDTIRVAYALDYSTRRFRGIVSDDAKDSELLKFVESIALAMRTSHIQPPRSVKPTDAKAGNLNRALALLENLPGESG
jgi:cellulose synthase/poly-beta-1,6-N-acetylglucosamine synthase-like glycosyltransferase